MTNETLEQYKARIRGYDQFAPVNLEYPDYGVPSHVVMNVKKRIEVKAPVTVVLKAEEVVNPVYPPLSNMYRQSIMNHYQRAPTALLTGGHLKGGGGMPWTGGPVSLVLYSEPIGSLMFCIGQNVAITLGMGLMGSAHLSNVPVSYHRRGVSVKVHTGIGNAGGRTDEYRAPRVPANRPPMEQLPGAIPGPYTANPGNPFKLEGNYPTLNEPWEPFMGIPWMPPVPSLDQLEESWRFLEEFGIDMGSWLGIA